MGAIRYRWAVGFKGQNVIKLLKFEDGKRKNIVSSN
jgi:hypothetical protein